ncbi:DUF6348 family protein [Dyella tabacisoli]|uniref:Uncharacterized protein n=1 Tax=Dyella tabacisoli TaxID=2282381 RepID=A0A369UQJ0_9GAMM|nr:DUF6348 family protein [Dyella tabacisoli]RDD81998.1 hypothetical protein DVJ77_09430 [Dyella tabacisoli]
MNHAALQNFLIRLFERHDVELQPDEDWLITDDDFPAIRASWHEGKAGEPGRLDIDVALSEERCIEESFAGSGEGEAACQDALNRFVQSDFYVLLAACWYVTDDRKMRLASWDIGVRSWDVFIGPASVQGADIAAPEMAGVLADAMKNESLTAEAHWVRIFYRRGDDGAVDVETLLDNAPWPAGDRAMLSLTWPVAEQAYRVRAFVVLDIRDY